MVTEHKQKTAEEILEFEIDGRSAGKTPVDFRNKSAHISVRNWAQWATVAGFIPIPIVDTAAIAGVQIKMIYDLCQTYEVEFKKELATSIVGALVGSSAATLFSTSVGNAFVRFIPVVVTTISFITQPALSYATTYAVGKTFIKHFENQGSLIDFDVQSAKGFFSEQTGKAKSFFMPKNVDVVDAVTKTDPQSQSV